MTYSWTIIPWSGDIEYADHETDAVTDSLDQYSEKPRFQAFLAGLMAQVQSLEDLCRDVIALRSVYTAIGDQLDTLGVIVDLDRGELSDDAYRIFLLGKIYANRAHGTIPEIYELLERLGLAGIKVHDHWPSAGLTIYAALVEHPIPTTSLLELMVPSGVNWVFEYNEVLPTNAFTFSSTINAEGSDADQGVGALAAPASNIGGKVAGSRNGGTE